MRKQLMAIAAAALLVVAAFVAATLLTSSSDSRSEQALEAAGLEQNEPGGEGRPVALDPNGAKAISAPGKITGKRGSFAGDVRSLDGKKPRDRGERPEQGQPALVLGTAARDAVVQGAASVAPAPSPGTVFTGLTLSENGNGYPPDTTGDVGPTYFIQAVNTSIGIFRKDGTRVSAFPFDGFIQGTNTLCDTDNYGDPVVVYDTFADRWVISDFAFTTDANGSVDSDNYQCFAVSKTGDPVTGGWYFYAFKVASGGDIADYPKLGVWPDGIYMSANVFGPSTFKNVRVWAFDKNALYAGSSAPAAVTFDLPQKAGGVTVFSLLPSNARAQTGTPPAGRPNLFASIYGSYQLRVWKLSPNWSGTATLTGPTDLAIATFNVGPSKVPSPANSLDTLTYRLMAQNQYANIGGTESLWLTHTVGVNNVAALRWYEVPVTGGTISPPSQQSTFAPDSTHRFMPSLAVDKRGDMAIGYSVSGSSLNPGLRYAGRLVSDPSDTLAQGETTMAAGGGSQNYTGRWGDYASMALDPDGCTFWFTSEIYATTGSNWNTKIGSFAYPSCAAGGSGGGSTAPAAPTGLTAVALSKSQIRLAWTDASSNETGFEVERSTNGTTFARIATTATDAVSFTDTGLARNTKYWYRVRAVASGLASAYTGTASATTAKN